MDKAKVKQFVKDHKKEIFIGVTVAVGGMIVYKITKQKPKFLKETVKLQSISDWEAIETERIKNLNWNLGEVTQLWNEGDCVNAIINDITVNDLGSLGEECLKIDSVTKDTTVTMLVGFLNKGEN